MCVLRLLDMALERLCAEGLIKGPLRAGFGQEAVSIGAAAALGEGDITITTHRPHAQHVAIGGRLGPMVAAMTGSTAADIWGGDNQVLDAFPRGGLSAGPCVVKQSPSYAIGHAYRQWLADTGGITLCVTEDCDVNSAAFNEAANMAAVWQLPVVILVENIRCALSVRSDRHLREPQAYRRAAAYGMPGVSVDGNDVKAVRDCVTSAVLRARAGGGPTLVQAITYRTIDFSGSDRGGYRDLAGSEQFLDPLMFARRRLIAAGATRDRVAEEERAACQLVADAVAFAKAGSRRDSGARSQPPACV
ncbi:dehydrogenase [Mycobacterium decipiens]|uniref:Dehydrogenase n=2 Tax=Mycobacterium decipiens TaxID=1430326 RepID=A0A1X2LS66_9MYCO|nr:dehydrogenase [Mycobacterium decipiens]